MVNKTAYNLLIIILFSIGWLFFTRPAHSELQNPDETVPLLGDTLPDDIFEDAGSEENKSGFSISGEILARGTFQTNEDDAVENNQSFRNRVLLEGK